MLPVWFFYLWRRDFRSACGKRYWDFATLWIKISAYLGCEGELVPVCFSHKSGHSCCPVWRHEDEEGERNGKMPTVKTSIQATYVSSSRINPLTPRNRAEHILTPRNPLSSLLAPPGRRKPGTKRYPPQRVLVQRYIYLGKKQLSPFLSEKINCFFFQRMNIF